MKRLYTTILFMALFLPPLSSQDRPEMESFRPIQFFIGLQPGFGFEPFDEHKHMYDMNVIPVQIEYSISNRWSIRLMPRADLHIRPYNLPAELSRIGSGLTVPCHFAKKNSEEGHRGFYAGPHTAILMHRLDNFMSATAAVELGYYFLFNSVLSFNVGFQAGRTIQMSPQSSFNVIHNHTAGVFAFGIWF